MFQNQVLVKKYIGETYIFDKVEQKKHKSINSNL